MNRAPAPSRSPRVRAVAAAIAAVCCTATAPAGARMPAANDRIAIMAAAVDAAGRPVADLTPNDLQAQLESGGATITEVAHVGAPKQIIVLLDTSATWARGPQKMIWNTQCVSTLAEHLAGASSFVVLGFSDRVVELYSGPADPERIDRALASAPRGGEAALLEVLKFMGESIAQQGIGDRTVLVVVSDGLDTASRASTKDVVRAIGYSGVPVYSLVVMDPAWNAQNEAKLNAKAKLLDISKATGGVSHSMNPGEVRGVTARIASMLAGRYRIEIAPQGALKSRSEAKLKLGARREGVEVYYADHVYRR